MTKKELLKAKNESLKSIPRELKTILIDTKGTRVKKSSSKILQEMRHSK